MGVVTDAGAGLAGGAAVVAVGHPLDTVKVLLQTGRFTSTFSAISHSWRTAGVVRGLYAGAIPAATANAAENAVLFLTYRQISSALERHVGLNKSEQPFLAGAAGGGCAAVLASLALTPIELVKCRMQVQPNLTAALVIRQVMATRGVLGLFTGLGATCSREIPGNFAFFGAYEASQSTFKEHTKVSEFPRALLSGGIGGMSFWLVSLPMDTIKTQVQVSEGRSGIAVARELIMRDGVKSLYRGCAPVLVRAFIANAALFSTVELVTEIMAPMEEDWKATPLRLPFPLDREHTRVTAMSGASVASFNDR
jgi:hypothetical protein